MTGNGSGRGSARSDGDSWDLTSSVGATATMVASARALASRGPDPLLDDRFAEPLVRAVGHPFFIRMLDGEIPIDDEMPLTLRQRCEQMAVRTRFFDDFLLAATAGGIRQAVILAAGLDARAYRLPWPAGTVVFEVDQPEVIAFKTSTLAQLGAEPAAERRAVAVDLRDDWPNALRDNFFDASTPTVWIAEGLLPYLPPDAQDRLLDNITSLSAPGSRLATETLRAWRSSPTSGRAPFAAPGASTASISTSPTWCGPVLAAKPRTTFVRPAGESPSIPPKSSTPSMGSRCRTTRSSRYSAGPSVT
ncbi:class I SAM-dependent methyltransferase [Mycobacterium sp. 050134]|uniref:class I SAM-dependent methyltransferase n=1 Tax=Mycobacterium sp. 050134 TaxID=3096111 RepID=UPI002ED89DF3